MPVTCWAEADVTTTQPSRPPDWEQFPRVTDEDTEIAFLCLKSHCGAGGGQESALRLCGLRRSPTGKPPPHAPS